MKGIASASAEQEIGWEERKEEGRRETEEGKAKKRKGEVLTCAVLLDETQMKFQSRSKAVRDFQNEV